jgi:hypothetical protein
MRVERFFHIRPPIERLDNGRWLVDTKGGATVRVVADTDSDVIEVQTSFCSKNDAFCRKTGRQYAESHPMQRIELKALPHYLSGVAFNVTRHVLKVPRAQRMAHPLNNMDWDFSTRYFRAKELACQC